MPEPRWLRIGDICSIEKGVTGLAAATPGEYPLVGCRALKEEAQKLSVDIFCLFKHVSYLLNSRTQLLEKPGREKKQETKKGL